MIVDLESVSIFIRPGATDMRKQSNGLSIIVNEQMHENPGSGNLYLFCSRNKRLLKCLWWDRTLEKKNQELTIEIKNLREQLYLALHRHYRRSSEKEDSSQLELFIVSPTVLTPPGRE